MAQRGKFITVEGGEGVGKSTNLAYIQSLLEAAGKNVIFTREPGGTPLGEQIRELLLGHREEGMAIDAELLLMFAARAEHIKQIIRPALEAGQWVLCDRFTDATYAYQGAGRNIELSKIELLENFVQGDLRPDLTLLLDLPIDVGLTRAGQRSAPDRFESEKQAFFEAVRTGYLGIAKAQPDRVKVINAAPSLDQVQVEIKYAVDVFLQQNKS